MANASDPKSTHSYIYNLKSGEAIDVTDIYANQETNMINAGYQSSVLDDDKREFLDENTQTYHFGVSDTSLRAYSIEPRNDVQTNGGYLKNSGDIMTSLAGTVDTPYMLEYITSGNYKTELSQLNVLTGYKFNDSIQRVANSAFLLSSSRYLAGDSKSYTVAKDRYAKAVKSLRDQYNSSVYGNPISEENLTYEMVYSDLYKAEGIEDFLGPLHRSLHIYDSPKHDKEWYWHQYTTFYNRFKVATTDDCLMRGFGHLFFTRPDCYLFDMKQTGINTKGLAPAIRLKPMFANAFTNMPDVIFELTQKFTYGLLKSRGQSSHFMMSLSNKANNFSVNEDYVGTAATGKTYTGFQIVYGKSNVESKANGSFSVEFTDDRSLHIYWVIRLWLEYISGCYRGTIVPSEDDIINKIIDYCSSLYYIITDETGENIIYWEKYYGIFPSNISNDSLSWQSGNTISNPKFNVTFQYSFRTSMDPTLIAEFNYNALAGGNVNDRNVTQYTPTYDPKLGHAADSWVGTPFIETVVDSNGRNIYKLRFMDESKKIKSETK